MFESQNPEKINIKDLSLDKPEKEGKTPEELREEFKSFLSDAFKKWYSDAKTKARIPEATDHLPELFNPKDQHWQDKKEDMDPSKFGEYTLNPETIDIDWGAIPPEKIIAKKLPDNLNDKSLADIAEYIIKTYEVDYYIPGIEYWKYIIEHPDKAPDKLKGSNPHSYYFFGSVFSGASGAQYVPEVEWLITGLWHQTAHSLAGVWRDVDSPRVVLLEKSAVVRKQGKDFTNPTPPMPEVRKF